MIMLKLSDVKFVMKKLLLDGETAFDSFLLSEATVKMGVTYTIDGHINSDFYTQDEIESMKEQALSHGQVYDEKLVRWHQIKSHVLSIIKGRKTPHSFNIVLYLSKENISKFISSLSLQEGTMLPSGLMLHLKYDGSCLFAVTGTIFPSFSLDKTIDNEWDLMVKKFFSSHDIAYEELS